MHRMVNLSITETGNVLVIAIADDALGPDSI